MPARWVCLDVSTGGIGLGIGTAGWFRSSVAGSRFAPFPGPGTAAAPPRGRDAWDAQKAFIAREIRDYLEAHRGPREGLLVALPDQWFKIGLMRAAMPGGGERIDEYAAWKVKSDWNLDVAANVYDWQPVSRGRGAPDVLLVASDKALLEEAGTVGEPRGLKAGIVVPRCVAAWNRAEQAYRGGGARELILRDGNAFTFFGVAKGRLRYFRSRACDDGTECDAEIDETRRHFRETVGASGPEGGGAVWSGGDDPRVLEGLLRHPLVGGAAA